MRRGVVTTGMLAALEVGNNVAYTKQRQLCMSILLVDMICRMLCASELSRQVLLPKRQLRVSHMES